MSGDLNVHEESPNRVCSPLSNTTGDVGHKDDTGKLRWSLLPWKELEEAVKVLMHGAEKYGDWNWLDVKDAPERYTNALMRHVVAYGKGQSTDMESGLPHLAHAICCALFLIHFDEQQP